MQGLLFLGPVVSISIYLCGDFAHAIMYNILLQIHKHVCGSWWILVEFVSFVGEVAVITIVSASEVGNFNLQQGGR